MPIDFVKSCTADYHAKIEKTAKKIFADKSKKLCIILSGNDESGYSYCIFSELSEKFYVMITVVDEKSIMYTRMSETEFIKRVKYMKNVIKMQDLIN